MVVDFKALRPAPLYTTYPPYHVGPYLEEYFYSFYKKNKLRFDKLGVTLIPAYWTNLYLNGIPGDAIQQYINLLPKDKKYFTVCQFDDGIQETLPAGTINFVAGGNKPGIPIPLICSALPSTCVKSQNKDIFCSFVGTILNNDKYACRLKLYEFFQNDPDFYFTKPRGWSNVVQQDQLREFIETTQRSIFTLCPRGYGLQSFRLYEALQLNSIPVFVYDKDFFPFNNFIDWHSFCVLVKVDQIPKLKEILSQITPERQQAMLAAGRIAYEEYFSLTGMCEGIYKEIKNIV
jgi:hypothetical protein